MMKAANSAHGEAKSMARVHLLAERETDQEGRTLDTPSPTPPDHTLSALTLMGLGLKVLSERTVAFAAHAFPVLSLAVLFAAWLGVKNDPSVYQLSGLGILAGFSLLMQLARRK